jgi:hypothetical protein
LVTDCGLARLPSKPADFPPTGDERPPGLACVGLAGGLFQHFCPYVEKSEADWPGALRKA